MEGCGKIPARPYFTHLSIYDAREYLRTSEGVEKAELKVNGTLMVCKKCGSYHVAETKFVDPNTNVIREDDPPKQLAWCYQLCGCTTLVDSLDYVGKNT